MPVDPRYICRLFSGLVLSKVPQVTVLALELTSSKLPSGKDISIDVGDKEALANLKKNPIIIKEGVEYNVRIKFQVNHSIISGMRYIQVVKKAGIKVDKLEEMLGSYGPSPTGKHRVTVRALQTLVVGSPYVKDFGSEEAPSGVLARSGTYTVRSRVVDDDGEVYAGKCCLLRLLAYLNCV